jgi:hypothetical protein
MLLLLGGGGQTEFLIDYVLRTSRDCYWVDSWTLDAGGGIASRMTEANSVSYLMGTGGSSPAILMYGRESDHSFP